MENQIVLQTEVLLASPVDSQVDRQLVPGVGKAILDDVLQVSVALVSVGVLAQLGDAKILLWLLVEIVAVVFLLLKRDDLNSGLPRGRGCVVTECVQLGKFIVLLWLVRWVAGECVWCVVVLALDVLGEEVVAHDPGPQALESWVLDLV